ncbi:MAG: hypothetical protein K8T89_02515 [Planctomycetes bacterium]|nr:hypothetical protein [Planctomycetota bacterium]
MFCRPLLATALFVLTSAPISAEDRSKRQDDSHPSTEPKDVPLELKIINAALEPYDVDPRGKPMFKFQENIRTAEENGRLLHPTYVDMYLEITNTGSATLELWVNGDVTLLSLDLKGNGARSASNKLTDPKGTNAPSSIKLEAGKSYRMPLKALTSGIRNDETYLYVTEPGIYKLSATFRTGVSPAPKGTTKILQNNFGEVLLKSAPLQFRAVRPS